MSVAKGSLEPGAAGPGLLKALRGCGTSREEGGAPSLSPSSPKGPKRGHTKAA